MFSSKIASSKGLNGGFLRTSRLNARMDFGVQASFILGLMLLRSHRHYPM